MRDGDARVPFKLPRRERRFTEINVLNLATGALRKTKKIEEASRARESVVNKTQTGRSRESADTRIRNGYSHVRGAIRET